MPSKTRRMLLSGVATLVASGLAGCVGEDSLAPVQGTYQTPQQPEDCPVTQNLDVPWPEELTEDTVDEFLEAYEKVYIEEIDFHPSSKLDGAVVDSTVEAVESHEVGYVVEVESGGWVYRPHLLVRASPVDPPEAGQVHDVDEIDDPAVRAFVEDAVEEEQYDESSAGTFIDRHVEAVDEFVASHSRYVGPGESVTLYFEVDDTVVALSLNAVGHHSGDWEAVYYVDENVIRRVDGRFGNESAPDGELLECRAAE